ncbi:MAG: PAS domain-containing protein [Mesorhizobium sp.]|nr:HWE histidine kinase domain-containing protein [Mesorhizobium sp.]MCO5161387.1 PAS domain-containing protein [Mesorhizobium sp.]
MEADLSRREAESAAKVSREELAEAVAENSPAMLWLGDQYGKCVFLNRAQRDFWGIDPQDLSLFDWGSTLHPDDIEKLSAPFVKAMAEQTPFSVEARYKRADGVYRTLRTEARPRFDRDGTFLGMTGVNTDISDQLAAEERTRMLMGELNHRTKNILTVVQAVARQTARNSTFEDFGKAFESRLRGLAACNDLLLRNDWAGVDLSDLIASQLGHLGEDAGGRLQSTGPRVRVASQAAQTLGMALHELSTNSLKYGALRLPDGRVTLNWSRAAGNALTLEWIESGVGPLTPPAQKGFGHSVIVDMVAAALDADVEVEFGEDGYRWKVATRSNLGLF